MNLKGIAKDLARDTGKLIISGTDGYVREIRQSCISSLGSSYKVEKEERVNDFIPKNLLIENGLSIGRLSNGVFSKNIYEPIHANHKGRHSLTIGGQRKGKSMLSARRFINKVKKGYGGAYLDNADGEIIDYIISRLDDKNRKRVVLLDYMTTETILPSIPWIKQKNEFTIDRINAMWNNFFAENFGIKDKHATYEFMMYVLKAVFENPHNHLGHVKLMIESENYRKEIVNTIKDKDTRDYWLRFNSMDKDKQNNKSTIAFSTRLNIVLNESRYQKLTLCQKPKIDHRKFLDNRNIVLIKCTNSMLSATKMIMTMHMIGFYNAFMSRDNIKKKEKRNQFHLFCDEPQTWMSKNRGIVEDIYTKAGKYGFYIHSIVQSIDQLKRYNDTLYKVMMDNEPDLFIFGTSKVDERFNLTPEKQKIAKQLPKYQFLYKLGANKSILVKSVLLEKEKGSYRVKPYNEYCGRHRRTILREYEELFEQYRYGMNTEGGADWEKEKPSILEDI